MYKHLFKNVVMYSNKKKIQKKNIIFFFYGLGLSSNDFYEILKNKTNYQILIPELPGHNSTFYSFRKNCLYDFSKTIHLFIKNLGIKKIIFFSHSVGGIIPILLFRFFLKQQYLKKFINYEGNLTFHDTQTITSRTASYKKNQFPVKFKNLLNICNKSNEKSLNMWYKSLKKVDIFAFYELSKETVKYSVGNNLLRFFRIYFKRKIYVHGSESELKIPFFYYGSRRIKILNCGHFSFYENIYNFNKYFNMLISEKW